MTLQSFRELLSQPPFRPFRIVMSSGQTYDVRHPEVAMLTRTDMLIGVGETEEGRVQDLLAAAHHGGRAAEWCGGRGEAD